MPQTLITGASGFIGWHVARLLVERGHRVRALCRPQSYVKGLDVERVVGDLRDLESIERAAQGCEWVFHLAADYRLWSPHPQDLYDSNVQGTRNVLEAAQRAGAKRIVYTSTVGCIGMKKDGEGTEKTPVSINEMRGHYKRSKWLAEQIALEKAREGLPVVIVNPTAPIGDHDWRPTPTGNIILNFLRNKLPAFVDTGLNFVDVHDTAEGHLLAAEKGRPGERYILGCQNLTLQDLLRKLAELSGKPAPTTRIPYALAYGAGLVNTAWANLTGKEPVAALEAVRMSKIKMFVSHAKATELLGFRPRNVEEALGRAIYWFRTNGYCA